MNCHAFKIVLHWRKLVALASQAWACKSKLQIAIISNFNPIRISGDGEVIVLNSNRDHGLVQPTKPRDFLLKFCFVWSETKIATTAFSLPLFFFK